jgi:UDP-glucose 4-epimerase
VRAVFDLMEAREISGEIFNVGSTERVRIVDLAHRVLELAESHSELVFVPHSEVYGLGIEDVLHREPSIEKIHDAIGWRPTLDLDRVLADVIDYTRRAPAVELA